MGVVCMKIKGDAVDNKFSMSCEIAKELVKNCNLC